MEGTAGSQKLQRCVVPDIGTCSETCSLLSQSFIYDTTWQEPWTINASYRLSRQVVSEMQAELGVYQKLRQDPCTAAIAAKAHFIGDLIIKGQSHPYMVMQRLGKDLEAVACAGLATAVFVQASCHPFILNAQHASGALPSAVRLILL